jgi:hypothetical protein
MRYTTVFAAALLSILLGACGGEPAATEARAKIRAPSAAAADAFGADVNQDLATLRQVTASFHDFDMAKNAHWSALITPCMTSSEGGMGFHYGNTDLIDGSVSVDKPELLLYEPEKNGTLRLVAVEYIVPLTAWTHRDPPRLFGRDFRVNEQFQVWALHAWVWKHNPSGMFADWNPNVTCAGTGGMTTMLH